jgi:signal transduction histidine kinase
MARLLLVDDVPDNVALMASCLRSKGYDLVSAASGVEALKLAAERPPDLALIDLMMPGLDGVETTRLLHRREATRSLPIILVTARGEASERLRALEAGVAEVHSKPFEPVELEARVASLLRIKMLNDELLRTREELLRRESLATIGTLVAGAAHEINSPLASALSFLEMLGEAIPDDGHKRDLAFAIEQLERVKRLVQGLLGLSRQTNDYEETLALEKVASDAVRVVLAQHRDDGVRIDFPAPPSLPVLRGNFAQLGQVAVNLIQNAAYAALAGRGLVQVTVGREDPPGGPRLFLRVEDNGAGVPPPLRAEIFKPFFTTKPPGQGTGLGLFTCRMIAEKHHGFIEVGDSPFGGAAFTLWIPLK